MSQPDPAGASQPPIDAQLREELSELTSSMCKALTDSKRLLILYALRAAPQTVGGLCELLDAPQSNTSQHLAVLRDRGLVEARRQANHVVYSLRHPRIVDAIDILRAVLRDELARRQALRAPTTSTHSRVRRRPARG